jgi:hypothetical protein
MDVAGPAVAVTGIALSVAFLIVVAVPVAFAVACAHARRVETDPADPWRLARRLSDPPPPVEDWRLALEARLRASVPYVQRLEQQVEQRVSELDTLEAMMYGDRVVPVVHGHG